MVVIFLPTASLTGTPQERIATPSICTVQAPHCAMPQPYLVPVRPIFSRITHSSGVSGSTSTSKVLPLMVRFAIAIPFFGPIHRLNFSAMLDRKLEQFKSRICVCSAQYLICFDVPALFRTPYAPRKGRRDTASRSRGAMRPRFASKFPYPPIRGRRECRAPDAPDSRVCSE